VEAVIQRARGVVVQEVRERGCTRQDPAEALVQSDAQDVETAGNDGDDRQREQPDRRGDDPIQRGDGNEDPIRVDRQVCQVRKRGLVRDLDEEGTPAARLKERAIEVDREVDAVDVAALESRIDDPEEHECGGRRPDGNHATIGLPAQEGIPVLGLPPPRAEGDNRERERREQDRP